jgi:hypothetical protein
MSTRAHALEHEKILYRYSSALARGDFAAVAEVLALAEADGELEGMLLELNQAYLSNPAAAAAPKRRPSARRAGPGSFFKRLIALIPPEPPAVPTPMRWALLGAGVMLVVLAAMALIVRLNQARFSQIIAYAPGRSLQATATVQALYAQLPAPTQAPALQPTVLVAGQPYPLPQTGGGAGFGIQPTPLPQTGGGGGFGSQPSQPYPLPQGAVPPGSQHLIVRDGSITLVVSDTRQARDAIQGMVNGMAAQGAYVVSSQEMNSGSEGQPAIQMYLRVPAERFDSTMNAIAALAVRVYGRDESAQDVTAEYVDLSAQLEQLQAARQRLLDIMKSASNTNDLLQAESLLTQRETQIASIQGRLKYLRETAQLSSIQVALNPSVLSQPLQPAGWSPAETARLALGSLVGRLQAFADWLITFSIATLPWLVVLGVIVLVAWRLFRRRVG